MIVSEKQAREACELLFRSFGTVDTIPLENLTVEQVVSRFKYGARFFHPDMPNGDQERFVALDRAKHVLIAWLERPQPVSQDHKKKLCDYCGGLGHVYTAGRAPGSAGLRRTCPKCRGSGDADIDLHNP